MKVETAQENSWESPEKSAFISTFQSWGIILIVGVLAALSTFLLLKNTPPVYEAEGSLIFRFGKEYFPADAAIETWQGEPIRVFVNEAIHTEMEILGSRRVKQAVVTAEKGRWRQSGRRIDLALLNENLSIKQVAGTYVVKVAMRDENPVLARHFLQTLFTTYLDTREMLLSIDPADRLEQAEREARAAVIQARNAVTEYQDVHDVVLLDEQLNHLLHELAATQSADEAPLGTVSGSRRELLDLVAVLKRQKGELAGLELALEIAEDNLRRAARLAAEYRISSDLKKSRGPVIEVLDNPESGPKPVGPSLATQTMLSGALAALGMAALIFLARWIPLRLADRGYPRSRAPTDSDDFMMSVLMHRSAQQGEPEFVTAEPDKADTKKARKDESKTASE